MPIAYIVASMRAALEDMDDARRDTMSLRYGMALQQLVELIDELEKHDGAQKKEAANDT